MDNADKITLLCKLPTVTRLQQLCDLAYQILGNPVFITDMAHTILAYTKCVEVHDYTWNQNIVNGSLDRNTLKQDREVGFAHDSSNLEHGPVLVEDSHLPFPRYIRTLFDKGDCIGVFITTAYMKPFDRQDVELIDMIASFAVPLMLKDRFFLSNNAKTVENYFIQLLDGAKFSPDRVKKRMEILEYPHYAYSYLLCIVAAPGQEQPVGTIDSLLDEFRKLKNCHVFLYNTAIICVYGSESYINSWDEEQTLADLLKQNRLVAGVSRNIHHVEHLREYYLQARDTVELSNRLGRVETAFFRYDSLSSFLLLKNLPEEELKRYCHEKIWCLWKYDEAHNMELCATLQVYLEQAKSLVKTADLLFIHRNTVRYRINKCMELMHTDFEDGNEIFAFILSLRILEYRKKFL